MERPEGPPPESGHRAARRIGCRGDGVVIGERAHSVRMEATYASWYSFQGFDYSNRRPVFQPGLTGTVKGVSIGVWGKLDQLGTFPGDLHGGRARYAA